MRRIRWPWARWALLLWAAALLAGCWDLEEIENRAFVLTLGVDAAEDGLIRVSAQIPVPSALRLAGAQGGGGAGTGQFYTVRATGRSTWEAIRALDEVTARSVYLGDLQHVIVGERLARRGVLEVLDTLIRQPIIDRQVKVMFTPDVDAFMAAPVVQEQFPALYLATLVDAKKPRILTAEVPLWRAWALTRLPHTAVALPAFATAPPGLLIRGAAVLDQVGRLAGTLTGPEMRGYLWVRGGVRGATLVVDVEGSPITISSLQVRTFPVQVRWERGTPRARVQVRVRGVVTGMPRPDMRLTREVAGMLEQRISRMVAEEVQDTFSRLQEMGADIYLFGERLRAQAPQAFNPERWEDQFRRMRLEVQVTAQIIGSQSLR